MYINFLSETEEAITNLGYTENDIAYCQISRFTKDTIRFLTDIQFSYEYFKEISNFSYDNGYGSTNVDETIKIAFKDNSWIERSLYDGSEWWEYKKPPVFNKDKFIEFPDISLQNKY